MKREAAIRMFEDVVRKDCGASGGSVSIILRLLVRCRVCLCRRGLAGTTKAWVLRNVVARRTRRRTRRLCLTVLVVMLMISTAGVVEDDVDVCVGF